MALWSRKNDKKSALGEMKAGLKWLFSKNAEGSRGYAVIYNETSGCLRWLFRENALGVRGIQPAATAFKEKFLSAGFAIAVAGAVVTGAIGGAGLSVKLSMSEVRRERLDEMFARIKTGDRSKVDRPFSFGLMVEEVGGDIAESYRRATVAPYALRGAGMGLLIACLGLGVKTVRRKYEESKATPAP